MPLYAVVAQSEYIRYRYKFDEKFDILEIPFLELKRKATKITASSGKVSHSVKQEETDVTRQDKKALIEKIFQKQEFSSQRLLKHAVAYRFDFGFYQDDKNLTKEQMDQHQIYELLMKHQGKLKGISGVFDNGSTKGICTLCNSLDEVCLFVTRVKSGRETYVNRGNYICKDSQACNKQLKDLIKMETFLNQLFQ
ncbi:hypothetical protein CHH51_18385 [Terribacillus saccharophilus]|nr:hypothetical protein CHH51_18385 [Terribacillus saccharophilus]